MLRIYGRAASAPEQPSPPWELVAEVPEGTAGVTPLPADGSPPSRPTAADEAALKRLADRALQEWGEVEVRRPYGSEGKETRMGRWGKSRRVAAGSSG